MPSLTAHFHNPSVNHLFHNSPAGPQITKSPLHLSPRIPQKVPETQLGFYPFPPFQTTRTTTEKTIWRVPILSASDAVSSAARQGNLSDQTACMGLVDRHMLFSGSCVMPPRASAKHLFLPGHPVRWKTCPKANRAAGEKTNRSLRSRLILSGCVRSSLLEVSTVLVTVSAV